MGCPGTTQKIRDIGCPVHIKIGIVCFLVAVVAAVLGVAEKTIFGVKNYKDMPGEGVICNLIGNEHNHTKDSKIKTRTI